MIAEYLPILNVAIVPLFIYLIRLDRKVTVVCTKVDMLIAFNSKNRKDENHAVSQRKKRDDLQGQERRKEIKA